MESPQEWLPAAQQGERWALEQFYALHHAQIYTLCLRMLGRAEDAEDAMQSAFVHAFRALPRFRQESCVKTWLYRIAVNEALSLLRRRRHAPAPLDENTPAIDGLPDLTQQLAVRQALAQVRPDTRTLLILRYWEQLSYEEIMAVLGFSLPTVKMRLSRARDEFRKCYERLR
jgi:RNA polymerase sigma-70 factor (ECF subfamily)